MSQQTNTIPAVDSNNQPILDPDGNPIMLAPGDTPIIIRGGSLEIEVIGSRVDDLDSVHPGMHFRHRLDKTITSLDIHVPGQTTPIPIGNGNCMITIHYE